MQIDPNRALRHSGACRYFRTGHTLDEPQDQCLPVGRGQASDRVEDCYGQVLKISASISGPDIASRRIIGQSILWYRTPVVVVCQIAGDRRQPRSKATRFP
jgi:hypothetical protein